MRRGECYFYVRTREGEREMGDRNIVYVIVSVLVRAKGGGRDSSIVSRTCGHNFVREQQNSP